jgi:non-specific serine/threonine protein kinase
MQEKLSFGGWLRKQRRALDLSRQVFADQVGCAEVTLRRIEAGTLKPSKELAGIVLEKLGIPENERTPWVSFARGLSSLPFQSSPSFNKLITNLPALLTTFIGREKEQSEVIRVITKHRLVTLTGVGGVGKTRLSIKVGEQVLGNYADGVWLVELASVLDALLVPRTTAIAIGLRDEPQRPVIDMLSDYLRGKQMLIILDNCEHLLDACAQLADTLLKRCPELKILATSREALSIVGEAVYQVPSLGLPNIQQLIDKFRAYESIRLFEERAQLVRMDFSLTLENSSSVAKICNRLDGIPLAIELAAARVSTLSTEQIEKLLQDSFHLLTTGNRTALPRQQTLQATIDWSYNLLSPAEQTLFRRLSVFVDGCTIEAAAAICADITIKSETILDLLTQLINKSLVVGQEEAGRIRYRMLETIRRYANEKLAESGEANISQDRHLEYFLNLAETAEPHLIRPEQLEWLPKLDADYENLRSAFEWALSKETAEQSLNFCKALGWFWIIRCHWLEGLNWSTKALAKPTQQKRRNEKVARARAQYTNALLNWQVGNGEQMQSSAETSLALLLEVSDKKDIAISRFVLGTALRLRGDTNNKAHPLLKKSLAEFEALSEPFWQAISFAVYGFGLARQEKLSFHKICLKYLELARKAGERSILADALTNYADWLFRIGQVGEAKKYAEESNLLYKQLGANIAHANSSLFADIAWSNGDYEKARLLLMDLEQRLRLLGDQHFRWNCIGKLGILAIEEGNLEQAQICLEEGLMHEREVGLIPGVAFYLNELGNLFYLQGNHERFKQSVRESFSLKNYLDEYHKDHLLMATLGWLYPQKPERSANLIGIIANFEQENNFPVKAYQKRYLDRAETCARKALGDVAFESAFAKGQKMTLDEALNLVLKTVEEM